MKICQTRLLFCLFTALAKLLFITNAVAFTLPENFTDTPVLENLQDTDGFAFSPDGRLFISERITGQLRVAKRDQADDSWSLNATPFYSFDTPRDDGGTPTAHRSAGLRDIAFDPDFVNNGYVYAFYMADSSKQNRVVRIKASTANPDVADASETLVIDLPFNNTDASGSHNGGALEFGSDGKLYITTGDGWQNSDVGDEGDPVQSLTTFTGKVLRVNTDGSIPNDNPFYATTTGNFRSIYALGLRNPYSMSKHPDTGELYINEARGSRKDQVYLVEAGVNYQHEGSGIGSNRAPWATAADAAGELITGGSWMPEAGLGSFPAQFNGNYFAILWGGNTTTTGHINVVASDSDPTVSAFASGLGVVGSNSISVKPVIGRFDAAGDLYYMLTTYTTSSAQIRRVRYTALETVATPQFTPNGESSDTPINVAISTDTADAEIRYTTDNSSPDTSSTLYSTPFELSASTVVRARAYKDNFNNSAEASAVFIIGDTSTNQPPDVNAGSNKIGFIGQSIVLDGSASTDPDGDDDFLNNEQWTQVSGPGVEIIDASEEIASFIPTLLGTYRFRLSMSDGIAVGQDQVTIAVIRPARAISGLQALYTFTEQSGNTIADSSNVGSPLDLTITGTTGFNWIAEGGLDIAASLDISSSGASKIIDACMATSEITLEAWIKPDNDTQSGPARILSLSEDISNRNFTMAQDGDRYDVRLRTTDTSANGTPSITVPASTVATELTHLVYTKTANDLATIFINGVPQVVGEVAGGFSNWDQTYNLLLANEESGDRPWLGEIFLSAVYCTALNNSDVIQNQAAGLAPFANPTDSDGDGVLDVIDNCPNLANANQIDLDKNNVGDVCEGQGMLNPDELCLTLVATNGAIANICL
ncbi:MAG: PQQ-dependent sugar dehydrogenase [Pseudomonadota bacterium]